MGMYVVIELRGGNICAIGPFKTSAHAASYASELFLQTATTSSADGIGVVELKAPNPAIEAAANA